MLVRTLALPTRSVACLMVLTALSFTVAEASESPVASIGEANGILQPGERGNCPDFYLNADESYEGGYAWQYGGIVPPDNGAFADCFEGPVGVCAVVLDLSQVGSQSGQTLDAYVWDDNSGSPGAVLCVVTDVDPGPIDFWPSLSRHAIDLGTVCVAAGEYWVGYWANWPDQVAGWFVGADLDGFGGCPFTKYAPGIGFPTGWGNVSAAWGPTQALGIGVEGTIPGDFGACCLPNGDCLITPSDNCEGDFLGQGTSCDPNLCEQPNEGACCDPINGQCVVTNAFDCAESGGSYLGDNIDCDPNPCPEPFGACCFAEGECTDLLLSECSDQGGTFAGDGTLCASSPCSDVGACCINDACTQITREDCLAADGIFLGFNVPCDSEICLTVSCDGVLVTLAEMGFEGDISDLPVPRPIGIGSGRGTPGHGAERGCGTLDMSSDGSYENGYAWEASIEPCYGSFAEKYLGSGLQVCSITLDLTQNGGQAAQLLDAYVWEDSGDQPGIVSHAEVGVDPGPVAQWPGVSRHVIPISATPMGNEWWVGFWGDWQGMGTGWFIGADTDGPGGNGSMTLAPPGQDLGPGWREVSAFWGPTQALGIGVSYLAEGAGACCFVDGSCVVVVLEDCEGDFQGEDSNCDPNPCPQPPRGACCFEEGTCTFVNAFACSDDGGTYLGDDTECEPNPCPQPPDGACCFAAGTCIFVDTFECADAGGSYLGDGIECDPNPCPQPDFGACCLPDQSCVEITVLDCDAQGGLFLGDESICDGVSCPILCDAPLTSRSGSVFQRRGTGPNSNGTLILHHDVGLVYTDDGEFCVSSLIDCESADARVDIDGPVVFQVLAAFAAPSSPRLAGVTFGVEYPDCLFILDGDPCGDFELPQSDWPESGTGTAVTWTTPQETFLVPVYWFGGYVDGGQAAALSLIPHPSQGAFFADDSIPAELDPILDLGTLGFAMEGYVPCPAPPEAGACCLPDGSCEVLLEDDCAPVGDFQGEGTRCDPNPCSAPATGACCFEDAFCETLTAAECEGAGGEYFGDDVPCDPNPCEPVPTIQSTWGKIKSRFAR